MTFNHSDRGVINIAWEAMQTYGDSELNLKGHIESQCPGTESQGAGAECVYSDQAWRSIQAYNDPTLNLGLLGEFTLCGF